MKEKESKHLANVYASISLAEGMPISQLGDNGNGVETSILSKGGRNDL